MKYNTAIAFAAMAFLAGLAASAEALPDKDFSNPNGDTYVVVADDPTQSYELYIPDTVTGPGPHSILYGFDPGGNGKATLQRLADSAKDQGWILAVSNNSRNGPWSDIFVAQDAVVRDTEDRFELHPTRRFASGFSGGARASLALACRYPDKVTGVLGLGAGDAVNTDLFPSNPKLAVYTLIGRSDSNFGYDVYSMQADLHYSGFRHFVQPYVGAHVWPSNTLLRAGAAWVAQYADTDAGPNWEFCGDTDTSWLEQDLIVGYLGGVTSQVGTPYLTYQRIANAPAKVTAITWWGFLFRYAGGETYQCARNAEPFRIAFLTEGAGVPDVPVLAVTVTPTKEYTGHIRTEFEVFRYRYEFPEPVDVSTANWLRISGMETGDACSWLWSGTGRTVLEPALQLDTDLPAGEQWGVLNRAQAVCVETEAFVAEGEGEGSIEGSPEGEGQADGEGAVDGEGEGAVDGEGAPDGEGSTEGEGESQVYHSTDMDQDRAFSLSELLRVIQFFVVQGFACAEPGATEDGFAAGNNADARECATHHADYDPQDWTLNLEELLRQVQLYNSNGYRSCGGTEDGFCPGA